MVARFESQHSNPANNKYVHSYTIMIANESDVSVQLISRHWIIKDSNTQIREVKGDGVVGVQPIIVPGKSYQYTSWCPLASEIGKMEGSFLMLDMKTDRTFEVKVPAFILCALPRMN